MQQLQLSSGIINILTKFAPVFSQPVFSQPTFENFLFLSTGAILTQGSRTVTNILRTLLRFPNFMLFLNPISLAFKETECFPARIINCFQFIDSL